MTTITFKLPDAEARQLRQQARRARISLSELLRRRVLGKGEPQPVTRQRCAHTGARIFGPAPHLPPLSTETVREMLSDFP
jgi:Mobilization protein NikA